MAERIARYRVDDGLNAAQARQRAAQELHLQATPALWPNEAQIEACVRSRLALFHPTQSEDLRILRQIALHWMVRLAAFEPHVFGPVWDGTATRQSTVELAVFSEDSTAVDIVLIEHHQPYKIQQNILSWHERHGPWRHPILMHLLVLDRHQDRPTRRRMSGSTHALRALLSGEKT